MYRSRGACAYQVMFELLNGSAQTNIIDFECRKHAITYTTQQTDILW